MPWGHRSGAVFPHDSALSTGTCVDRLAHSDSSTYHTCESVPRGCRGETTGWKPTERHESEICARRARAWSDGKQYLWVSSSEIYIISQINQDVHTKNAMRICSAIQKRTNNKRIKYFGRSENFVAEPLIRVACAVPPPAHLHDIFLQVSRSRSFRKLLYTPPIDRGWR